LWPTLSQLQIQEIAENDNPWMVFVETTNPEKQQEKLPYFEKDSMYASCTYLHISVDFVDDDVMDRIRHYCCYYSYCFCHWIVVPGSSVVRELGLASSEPRFVCRCHPYELLIVPGKASGQNCCSASEMFYFAHVQAAKRLSTLVFVTVTYFSWY